MMADGQDDGGSPAPGWYPDPENPGNRRWWDGIAWSTFSEPLGGGSSTSPASGASVAPTPGPGGVSGAPPGAFPASSTPGVPSTAPTIDPWLWQSILATIFCCQPLGIVGIAFAAQSQTAMSLGSYDLARRKARTARIWTLWAAGVALAGLLVWGLFFAVGVASMGF